MKTSNPEYTVDQIVARMRQAAARNAAASTEAVSVGDSVSAEQLTISGDSSAPVQSHTPALDLQPSFEPHSDDVYNVNDLLRYHGRDFIQNAYRAILKRTPDAGGYHGFTESLHSGHLNKIDILARLRYSQEGRSRRVRVDGLVFPAAIRAFYRIPVIGYLLNLVIATCRLPVTIRSQQRFESYVLAQQQLIADQVNQVSQSLQAYARRSSLEQTNNHEAILNRISELSSFIEEATSEWQKQLANQQTEVQQLNQQLNRQLNEILKREFDRISKEFNRVFQKEQQVSAELALQGQRLATLLEEARKRLPAPFDRDQMQAIAIEGAHSLDAFYASFDEQFRGSFEQIKQRLSVYLPLIRGKGIGAEAMPLLDLGCGRGEWLELLKQEQLRAAGVDSNRVLVDQCRTRGLDVVEQDLLDYLCYLPDASLGAVTGFHIVEHLPVETLVKVLDQTVRVLKPGGVVIFETPDPQNVLVGTCNFYLDPTHRNPLPSPVMKFLLESKGFIDVEVLRLNPSDQAPIAGDSEIVSRFNDYFYGPMDYAVIGWRT